MSGRPIKRAAAAASLCLVATFGAHAQEGTLDWSLELRATPLEPSALALSPAPYADRSATATAGATFRYNRHWRSRLFVSRLAEPRSTAVPEAPRPSSTVGAQLSGRLSKHTRLSIDVFNVFDQPVAPIDYVTASRAWSQPGVPENHLFHPAEPRGIRFRITRTF